MRRVLTIDHVDKQSGKEIHLPVTLFKRPSNEKEYAKMSKALDTLLDIVRDDENHCLAPVIEIIGENLEEYDNNRFPAIGAGLTDAEKLKYLMESHHLRQVDLADIFGGQANVSKILRGERTLNNTHIKGLIKKFGISAQYFYV